MQMRFAKILLMTLLILLLSSCSSIAPQPANKEDQLPNLSVKLAPYQQSNFKQVQATFFTRQSKEIVFRVLSDIKQTPQWLENAESLQVLEVFNNSQYLLRSVISSPWPFNKRELITCVNTNFDDTIITIHISSCSDQAPQTSKHVRLSQLTSDWTITTLPNGWVKVNYKAWLDPRGYVPAFFFNRALKDKTTTSMKKLQLIIENTTLSDYSY